MPKRGISALQLRDFVSVADAMRPKTGSTANYSLPGVVLTGDVTRALALNTIYYFPFHVTQRMTIDRLSIDVDTAATAGGVARVGIYEADEDAQPLGLVVDSGEFATDSAGTKQLTVTAVLEPGRYLTALLQGTAAPVTGMLRGVTGGLFHSGGSQPSNQYGWLFRGTQTYGALPDPGTAWDTISQGGGLPEFPILMRIASFG